MFIIADVRYGKFYYVSSICVNIVDADKVTSVKTLFCICVFM